MKTSKMMERKRGLGGVMGYVNAGCWRRSGFELRRTNDVSDDWVIKSECIIICLSGAILTRQT